MKRIISMSMLYLAVFALLPFQFVWSIAKAEERVELANGVYQVELSFLLLEVSEHEELFSRNATLTVQDGQYTLSVPMKYETIITSISAKQQGENILSLLDRTENLVQFDMKDVKQKIVLDGTIKIPLDEKTISFSEEIVINIDSLPQEELPETSQPTPPLVEQDDQKPAIEDKQEHHFFNYILLTDGKEEPSIMNTYVNPIMKIVKIDDRFYAQMEILKSSWITGLTVEQQGEMIEPAQLSLVDNTRIVQFEVKDFHKKFNIWVKVDIRELTYHHDYYVQLQFDEHQVATFLGESLSPIPIKPSETKKPVENKPSQQSQLVKPKENTKQSVVKPAVAQVEEILTFDRTVDGALEEERPLDEPVLDKTVVEKQNMSNAGLQVEPVNKLKISMLVLVCILSGILLIRRFKNGKKDLINE